MSLSTRAANPERSGKAGVVPGPLVLTKEFQQGLIRFITMILIYLDTIFQSRVDGSGPSRSS